MDRLLRWGGTILVAASLPACATITRGTKQKYSITSEPAGADVALTTGESCVTPCKLKLKRKNGFTARITKPGYEVYEAEVKSKMSGGGGAAVAGNVLVGGLIGGVIDGSNGSMNSLFPKSIDAKLVVTTAGPSMEGEPTAISPADSDPASEPKPVEDTELESPAPSEDPDQLR